MTVSTTILSRVYCSHSRARTHYFITVIRVGNVVECACGVRNTGFTDENVITYYKTRGFSAGAIVSSVCHVRRRIGTRDLESVFITDGIRDTTGICGRDDCDP